MDNIVQIDLYTRCLTNACSLTKVNIQPFLVDVFHHRLYLPFVPELEKKASKCHHTDPISLF